MKNNLVFKALSILSIVVCAVCMFIKAKGALLAPIMFKTANQASTII